MQTVSPNQPTPTQQELPAAKTSAKQLEFSLTGLCILFAGISALWLLLDHRTEPWDAARRCLENAYIVLGQQNIAELLKINGGTFSIIQLFEVAVQSVVQSEMLADFFLKLLWTVLLCVATFRLARTLFDKNSALLAVALVNFLPGVCVLEHTRMLEIPVLVMILLVWNSLAIWLRHRKKVQLLTSGSLATICALSKQAAIPFIFAAPPAFIIAIFACLHINYFVLFDQVHSGATLGNLVCIPLALGCLMSWPLATAAIVAVFCLRARDRRTVIPLLALTILGAIITCISVPFEPEFRYFLPCVVPLVLALTRIPFKPARVTILALAALQFVWFNFFNYPIAVFVPDQARYEQTANEMFHSLTGAPQPEDYWGQEWLIKTCSKSRRGKDIARVVLLPNNTQLNSNTMNYLSYRLGEPVSFRGIRTYFNGRSAVLPGALHKDDEFYVQKTGRQGLAFIDKHSRQLYKEANNNLTWMYKFDPIGSFMLPDGSVLRIWRPKTFNERYLHQ